MAKSEWGKKRFCQSCGEPFYDLNKKTIECPKCGGAFNPEPLTKPKRPVAEKPEAKTAKAAPSPAKEKPAAKAVNKDEAGKEVVSEGGESNGDTGDDKSKDDELIEDTSDLGEDDDDMSEVKEHIDDGIEDKN